METDGNICQPKLCSKFMCEICDYYTSKKSSYLNHIDSKRHNFNALETNGNKIMPLCSKKYSCDTCDKQYAERSGLWKHKKVCSEIKKQTMDSSHNNEVVDMLKNENKEIMEMLKQQLNENTEFRKQIVDIMSKQHETISTLASKAGGGGGNITNNNSHNKTFNLNVFLNETCKDAINMTDFVNSIQVQIQDLENTGKLGYVEGITKIFLQNLNGLNRHCRPIHCSDLKREIIYIKDNNQWTKEDEDKIVLQRAIKEVANKNMKQISDWVKEHPDCYDATSKMNDTYLKIVSNAMSGASKDEQLHNIHSIIKNLAKEVVIYK